MKRVYSTVCGRLAPHQNRAFFAWFGTVGVATGVPTAIAQLLSLGAEPLSPAELRKTIRDISERAIGEINSPNADEDRAFRTAIAILTDAVEIATRDLAPPPETLINAPKGSA